MCLLSAPQYFSVTSLTHGKSATTTSVSIFAPLLLPRTVPSPYSSTISLASCERCAPRKSQHGNTCPVGASTETHDKTRIAAKSSLGGVLNFKSPRLCCKSPLVQHIPSSMQHAVHLPPFSVQRRAEKRTGRRKWGRSSTSCTEGEWRRCCTDDGAYCTGTEDRKLCRRWDKLERAA
jgi:hypothetical protein